MATQELVESWLAANQAYLEAEFKRLRLLLQRRVLWLRRRWQEDALVATQGLVISDAQADWLLESSDARAEAHFYAEDPEAAAITRSIAEIDRVVTAQARERMEEEAILPLEMLAQLLGLSPFEQNVLLLCLAPELDPTFAPLYAYVQDHAHARYPTPFLARTLFRDPTGEDSCAGWDAFLPGAPLRRFCLASPQAAGDSPSGMVTASSPLRLDERMVNFLRGVNQPDERVAGVLRSPASVPLSPAHRALAERVARVLDSTAGEGMWPVLNLTGPAGSGRRAVAEGVCTRLGFHLLVLDAGRLPPPGPGRREMMRWLEREATLLPFAFYLDATDLETTDLVDDLIGGLGAFLIVSSRERWRTEHDILAVRVPKPDASAQRALWQQALDGVTHTVDGRVDALVQQFDLGPRAIARAVAAAVGCARLRAPGDGAAVTATDIWQACREQTGLQMDELAQRIAPCYTWDDIVLPADVFCQLREIAAQVAHRPQVYETWGFGAKLSRGRGISALFSGPSGTGKTMAAEILAHHLNLDLYRIDLAGVVSKYIGETEKNLKRVFDAAEQSGAILFFDEADALFGKRTEVKDSHDRYANIEVNYLLQRMEDYRGLAILATNRKSVLDWAFLRRLRFLVDFPFPDFASRRGIWQKVFPVAADIDGLDYDVLARLEIPGGNIRNIALNAAFLAASEGAAVGMAHVFHAARREYAKIDKLVTESEFGPYYRRERR
jgi:ATP-dependent 26S proteasome regulatory subunit